MDDYKNHGIERKKNDSKITKRGGSSDVDSISFNIKPVQDESKIIINSDEVRREIVNKEDNCSKLLLSFSKDNLNFDERYLRTEFSSITKELHDYDEKLNNFGFRFIKRIHYLYKLDEIKDLPEILRSKLDEFKDKSSKCEVDDFVIYKTFDKLLVLLSRLMIKMGIFDIHNYRYRFKGRSLTIMFFNMAQINKGCLAIDVIWMCFAINHMPFKENVGKLILNYSKILKHCLKRIFRFLMETNNIENENFIDFESVRFEIVPFYMRIFKSKTPQSIYKLYDLLNNLEKSYRCFERALLEESLKMV